MPRYRNHNTGQVVELAKRSHRLERLANWEQVEDDVEDADFEPAEDSAVQPSSNEPPAGPSNDQPHPGDDESATGSEEEPELTREYVIESLNGATNEQLRAVAAERGLDTSGRHADLVERIADEVLREGALDAEESS